MNCEMCGSEDNLVMALVEGVELKVCQKCVGYGKVLRKPIVRSVGRPQSALPSKEVIQIIKEDYSKIIREKREKMGLKQNEFARYLTEKESLIHQIESGTYTPSIELARKLERQLSINLIEEKELAPQHLKAKTEEYTIGDMVKIK